MEFRPTQKISYATQKLTVKRKKQTCQYSKFYEGHFSRNLVCQVDIN